MEKTLKSILEISLVIAFFVLFSYLIQSNLEFFKQYLSGYHGILIYLFITFASIVVAPVSSIPLISIASHLWGVIPATILTTIGWSLGAITAFTLSRKYGVKIVRKLISLENIYKIEKKIPKEDVFWSILLLRLLLPLEIVSYALGLFSKVELKKFSIAVVLGGIPHILLFAYLGEIPFMYQIIGAEIALISIVSFFILRSN